MAAKHEHRAMNDSPILQVGLLLCDDVDESAQARYGTYTEMFRRGINAADANLVLTPIRCHQGEMADSPDDFDAFLISGSRHGVYDPPPWIAQLQDFVRRCRERRRKTVGICFGHQLIAHALGGETRKADAGWGMGIQRAALTETLPWMGNESMDSESMDNSDLRAAGAYKPGYNLVVLHQDQVVALPPGFRVIAKNDFCPVSMFVGDDVMLGIQGHPEFDKKYCEFRVNARRELVGREQYRQSLASLERMELDSARVLGWVARFIRS